MDWFRYQAFVAFLNDPMYPEHMRTALIGRIQVERPELLEELRKQHIQFLEQLEKQQQKQE
jgi:tRNA uridine 5-carbamoylmethylation protein Kti12